MITVQRGHNCVVLIDSQAAGTMTITAGELAGVILQLQLAELHNRPAPLPRPGMMEDDEVDFEDYGKGNTN